MVDRSNSSNIRNLTFALLIGISVLAFWREIAAVVELAWHTDEYTHIFLIIPLCLILIYLERGRATRVAYAPLAGIIVGVLAAAIAIFGWVYARPLDPPIFLPIKIFSLVMFWMGCIVGCYGAALFRVFLFPFLMLFLLVPPPASLLDKTIYYLQTASTESTFALFKLTGLPVLKNGFLLTFPTLRIEVAKECSGIRSSIMLLLTGLILAHLFLRSLWTKVVFVLFIVPFSVAKNAVRIFALSMLSMYVDPGFLYGRLHHEGGIVFFLLALGGLLFLLWILQRADSRIAGQRPPHVPPVAVPAVDN